MARTWATPARPFPSTPLRVNFALRVSGPALGGKCEWIDGTIVLGERTLEIHA